jgi:transposase
MKTRQKPRETRTSQDWAQDVRAWKRSGLTAKEYAKAHGLSASTLMWWSWRLKRDAPHGAQLQLVEVEVEEDGTTALSWEVVSANGHVLRVQGSLSAELAHVVMTALTKAGR